MKFVEEVVVDEFLPTLRSMLAAALSERGLTQREVAEALGISQSAVSKYAHGEIKRNPVVLEDDRVNEYVARTAEGLATGEMSPVQALVEAEILIRRLEARGDVLARLHEDAVPSLAAYEGEYRIHDPDSGLRSAEHVRSSVRRGLRVLENTTGFPGLIPNVGSNLVECLPGASTIDDVAGVPGRLFDVEGRTEIPGSPEFGVSAHVASVLLAARDCGRDVRAAVNVKYAPGIVEALEAAGLVTVEFQGEDDLEAAICEALEREPDADVLYQTGGFGIEPITYVLGPDSESVARTVRALTR